MSERVKRASFLGGHAVFFGFQKKVQNYKPKTSRAKADSGLMKRAVDEVEKGHSIRQVARDLNIDRITLSRYVKKFRAGLAATNDDFKPCFNHRQVRSVANFTNCNKRFGKYCKKQK